MVVILTDEQSTQYLEGSWEAYRIEEDVLNDLEKQGVNEPVAVCLRDGTTAFYVTAPGVIV